jgi:hypothetical protein
MRPDTLSYPLRLSLGKVPQYVYHNELWEGDGDALGVLGFFLHTMAEPSPLFSFFGTFLRCVPRVGTVSVPRVGTPVFF